MRHMEIDPEIRRQILDARARIFWRRGPRESDPAGHAYVCSGTTPTLLYLVHSAETTPAMLAVLKEWEAIHLPGSELERLRSMTSWRPPVESEWSFSMDAAVVAQGLASGAIAHVQALGPNIDDALRDFPLEFLKDPVKTIVFAKAGAVTWPDELDASVLRPGFGHAIEGDHVLVTACRYGSRLADSGQDRTAAVFLSQDAGQSFEELEWRLPLHQRLTPAGRSCFPPEQIDRAWFQAIDGALVPCIEWEDPWIAFEPGSEWKAHYDFGRGHWLMQERVS